MTVAQGKTGIGSIPTNNMEKKKRTKETASVSDSPLVQIWGSILLAVALVPLGKGSLQHTTDT